MLTYIHFLLLESSCFYLKLRDKMEINNDGKFEIYFYDLKEEVQDEFLKFRRISKPETDNLDIIPIAVLER